MQQGIGPITHDPEMRHATLSRREREVAAAYAEGESHKEIASRLFLAPSTVRTHLGSVYRKLGVSSKIELRRLLASQAGAEAAALTSEPGASRADASEMSCRASVAIMPFSSGPEMPTAVARAFVHDIVTRLAKLRSMRVIASGSVFALSAQGFDHREAADLLAVDYAVTGSILNTADRIHIFVELERMRSAQIIWAEDFDYKTADTLLALDTIGDRIVAAVAAGIETAERNRALLKPPQSLDAWESFHRGLWHMYRFTVADNEQAQQLFRRAIAMDPTFSRAHAGLSFTHFQNAFLLHPGHRQREMELAIDTAGESLVADRNDPAAHWAMGRALWLHGEVDQATAEIVHSVELAPNFAVGHYTHGFIEAQTGDPKAAIGSADRSCHLSPFDPLMFGMLGSRALALFRMGAFDEAADWAVRASARPNAHVHIHAITAHCLAAADRLREARQVVTEIHAQTTEYRVDDFLAAFRFPPTTQALFRRIAARIGTA
jgi:TolB-like protein/DNA-binding CsgD family transcriptional regulator